MGRLKKAKSTSNLFAQVKRPLSSRERIKAKLEARRMKRARGGDSPEEEAEPDAPSWRTQFRKTWDNQQPKEEKKEPDPEPQAQPPTQPQEEVPSWRNQFRKTQEEREKKDSMEKFEPKEPEPLVETVEFKITIEGEDGKPVENDEKQGEKVPRFKEFPGFKKNPLEKGEEKKKTIPHLRAFRRPTLRKALSTSDLFGSIKKKPISARDRIKAKIEARRKKREQVFTPEAEKDDDKSKESPSETLKVDLPQLSVETVGGGEKDTLTISPVPERVQIVPSITSETSDEKEMDVLKIPLVEKVDKESGLLTVEIPIRVSSSFDSLRSLTNERDNELEHKEILVSNEENGEVKGVEIGIEEIKEVPTRKEAEIEENKKSVPPNEVDTDEVHKEENKKNIVIEDEKNVEINETVRGEEKENVLPRKEVETVPNEDKENEEKVEEGESTDEQMVSKVSNTVCKVEEVGSNIQNENRDETIPFVIENFQGENIVNVEKSQPNTLTGGEEKKIEVLSSPKLATEENSTGGSWAKLVKMSGVFGRFQRKRSNSSPAARARVLAKLNARKRMKKSGIIEKNDDDDDSKGESSSKESVFPEQSDNAVTQDSFEKKLTEEIHVEKITIDVEEKTQDDVNVEQLGSGALNLSAALTKLRQATSDQPTPDVSSKSIKYELSEGKEDKLMKDVHQSQKMNPQTEESPVEIVPSHSDPIEEDKEVEEYVKEVTKDFRDILLSNGVKEDEIDVSKSTVDDCGEEVGEIQEKGGEDQEIEGVHQKEESDDQAVDGKEQKEDAEEIEKDAEEIEEDAEEIEEENGEDQKEEKKEAVKIVTTGEILGVFSGIVNDVKTQIILKDDFIFVNELDDYKIDYKQISSVVLQEENDSFSFYQFEIMGICSKWTVEKSYFDFKSILDGMLALHQGRKDKLEEVIPREKKKSNQKVFDESRTIMLSGNTALFEELLNEYEFLKEELYDLLVHSIYSYQARFIPTILDVCPDVYLCGSPICIAIQYNYFEPVMQILHHKAINKASDFSSLHVLAVLKNGTHVNVEDLNCVDNHGWTALHVCAAVGNLKLMKWLLEAGANQEVKDQDALRTPLHISVIFDQLQAMRILLQYDSNRHAKTLHGYNILHLAAKFGRTEFIDEILRLKQVDKTKDHLPLDSPVHGISALYVAVKHSQVESCVSLLERGSDPNDIVDDQGNTLLHYVCGRSYCKDDDRRILSNLIEGGADINAENSLGQTPLFVAMNCITLHSNQGTRNRRYRNIDYVDVLVRLKCVWKEDIIKLVETSSVAKSKFYAILRSIGVEGHLSPRSLLNKALPTKKRIVRKKLLLRRKKKKIPKKTRKSVPARNIKKTPKKKKRKKKNRVSK